jgi:hypothetical protein
MPLLDDLESLIASGSGVDRIALIAEPAGHRIQDVAVVVNEQEMSGFHALRPG